jgi:hypothetical protein
MSTADETNAGAPVNDSVDQSLDLGLVKRDDNTTVITIVGDESAMRLFGTPNRDFFHGLMQQVANAGAKGEAPDELGVRFILASIAEEKPADTTETLILSQRTVCHRLFMEAAHRYAHAESLAEADFADRSMNRLARTFAALTDALQRYRATKGQKLSIDSLGTGNGAQATIGSLVQPTQQVLLNEAVTGPGAGQRRAASEVTGKRRSGVPRRHWNQHGQP